MINKVLKTLEHCDYWKLTFMFDMFLKLKVNFQISLSSNVISVNFKIEIVKIRYYLFCIYLWI
jgi:hypothetical protein